MHGYERTFRALQRQWGLAVGLYALGFLGLAWWLRPQLAGRAWLLWLGMSSLIGYAILMYLYTRLPENVRDRDLALLPTLGLGTGLSLAGGWCLAVMGGFLVIPQPSGRVAWLPAVCFLLALAADLWDGYLARRRDHVTALGADLDMTLDGLGVLLAAGLAVRWGKWPFWYLSVGLARYLFVWGLAWRRRQGWPIQPLSDSVTRRLLAGMLRGFLWVVLWPGVPAWWATAVGLALVLPFLVHFIYDFLVASMVVDSQDPDFRAAMARWRAWTRGPLALGLRFATGLGAVWVLLQAVRTGHPLANMPGLPALAGLLTLFLILGLVPRLAALGLYGLMGWLLINQRSFWFALLTMYGLTFLFLWGVGPKVWWQPEARFFTRRLGS